MSYEPHQIVAAEEIDPSSLVTVRIPEFLEKASLGDQGPENNKGRLRRAAGAAATALKGTCKFAFRCVASPYAATTFGVTGALGFAAALYYPSLTENFGPRSGWSTATAYAVTNGTTGETHECVGTSGSNYGAAEACADYIANADFPISKLQMSYSLADQNIRGMTALGETHGRYGDPYDGGSRTYTDVSREDALQFIEAFQMGALENDGKIILQPGSGDYWRYQAYVKLPNWASTTVSVWKSRIDFQIEDARDSFAGFLESAANALRSSDDVIVMSEIPLEMNEEPLSNTEAAPQP